MNALADNAFTRTLRRIGDDFSKPKAIVVISAHWMTDGTWVTAMAEPRMIYDFYGFPKALFEVQYPAPGSPETANQIQQSVTCAAIQLDRSEWGLDHGAWSVLRHMYPQADVPIVQLSLDRNAAPDQHYRIGQQLRALREADVMILGSGNIVHNLRVIRWEESAPAYDWAVEFDRWVKDKLERREFSRLMNVAQVSPQAQLSVPTSEHFDPLLYVLGASEARDELRFEYEEIQNGSISMRTVSFR